MMLLIHLEHLIQIKSRTKLLKVIKKLSLMNFLN